MLLAAANSFRGRCGGRYRLMHDRDAGQCKLNQARAANRPALSVPATAKNFCAPLETKTGFF
jgi:hypothetical protein